MRVSRSGYYAWEKRPESLRSRGNRRLLTEIKAIHLKSKEIYGSPRIHQKLKSLGHLCGKNRVAKLMSEHGIRSKTRKKFKVTTDSKHRFPIAPNWLARDFRTKNINEVWLTDITYIETEEGWLYLAAVMDLNSRRIVGWALEDRMTKAFACRALTMAYARRKPAKGLVHHSDRGSQYASHDYQKLITTYGMKCSMSRKGDCWDNAPMESFFHTLKTELVHHQKYVTRAEAKSDIIAYIEMLYNSSRIHSALRYKSPLEFERIHLEFAA